MTRPWHLQPESERERLLQRLSMCKAFAPSHGEAEAYAAAAALLRAEPAYPDDCPAFAVDLGAGEEHVEICGMGVTDAAGRKWVTLVAPYGWREPVDCVASALRPLTPAAAELLAALRGEQ